MNRRKLKRMVCAATACSVLGLMAVAEEPQEASTAAPTAAETQTAEATAEPTAEATPEPTAAPTAEPTAELTAEPTVEPSTEPTRQPNPSAMPSAMPTGAPVEGFQITMPQGSQLMGEIYQISYQQDTDELEFAWPTLEGAVNYRVLLVDEENNILLQQDQQELNFKRKVSEFGKGTHTLNVQALDESGNVLDECIVKLTLTQGMTPVFPGGGFPSGGFSFSGMSGGSFAGGKMAADTGFHVIPGEALTSSHTSGDKNMQLYGTVELTVGEDAMSVLTIGGEELAVVLDDQQDSFYAALEDGILTLTPVENGTQWSINALALEILNRSGVETLALNLGDSAVELSTEWLLQGSVYAKLCASGIVSKDYTLQVSRDGTAVTVDGGEYTLDENHELIGG